MIALIKLVNIVIGFVRHHTLTAVHSVINKLTGVLLFILPFTIPIINIRYSAPLVCLVATAAAITESRTVTQTEKTELVSLSGFESPADLYDLVTGEERYSR